MERETLEDQLRRATRNFTSALPEDQVLALGRDLARELALAHGETPPRHPEIELRAIPMVDGAPRLEGGDAAGDASEDLFQLGALLGALATGTEASVSWRLDGPPAPEMTTLGRRAVLAALAAPRRSDRYPSAAAAAAALDAVLDKAPGGPAPWPLFRGDAGRTGSRQAAASSCLQPVWEAGIGAVVASPVVTVDAVVAATADGRLVWLDRQTGRRLHEIRLAGAIESSPALGEDQRTLHAGTDDGEIVGIDAAAGRERYRVRLGRLVRSSPLPLGGRVIVGVVEGKTGGALVALDAAKGTAAWARKMGPVFSSPAGAGPRVVLGSDDGSVYAIDPAKGTVLWSTPMAGKVRATPAICGELAVVADFGGRVAALRLADGTAAWMTELGHAAYSSPCAQGDLVVVGCNEGHLHAVDIQTGTARFEVKTRGPVVSSPVAAGDRFVAGSTDGSLYLVDPGGRVLDRRELAAGGVQSSPALDGDVVFIGSARGVHAVRLAP
jgi:outer membrane protein assembly factor BamB